MPKPESIHAELKRRLGFEVVWIPLEDGRRTLRTVTKSGLRNLTTLEEHKMWKLLERLLRQIRESRPVLREQKDHRCL